MDSYLYIKLDENFTSQEIDSFLYSKVENTSVTRLVNKSSYNDRILNVLLYEKEYSSSFTLTNPNENKEYNFKDLYYQPGESKGCCDCGGVEYISFKYKNVEMTVQEGDTFVLER